MATNRKKRSSGERFAKLGIELGDAVPHFYGYSEDPDQFIELRIKLRGDGSYLAILKGYGSDGTPLVCFGVGYGVAGALMAINATVAGGHWRVDKPYEP